MVPARSWIITLKSREPIEAAARNIRARMRSAAFEAVLVNLPPADRQRCRRMRKLGAALGDEFRCILLADDDRCDAVIVTWKDHRDRFLAARLMGL